MKPPSPDSAALDRIRPQRRTRPGLSLSQSPPCQSKLGLTLALGLLSAAAFASAQTSASSAANSPVSSAAEFTLDAALARLTSSPSVTQATLSVQVAQANLDAARTALGLSVSLTGNAAYTGGGSATAADGTVTTTAGVSSGSAGVNLSLGVLPWSANQSSLRSAQRSLNLAQVRLNETLNAAKLNVAQQYYAGVLATQDLKLADQTRSLRERQLAVARVQQENGNATPESVLSAQAGVQGAQAAQLQAAASLDAARRSLSAALGTELGTELETEVGAVTLTTVTLTTLPPDTLALPDVSALVAQARAQRREVIEAQGNLLAAQDTLETQRRNDTLPDLSAALRYGPSSGGGLSASLNLKQGTLGAGYTQSLSSAGTAAPASAAQYRLSASLSGSYVLYSPTAKAQGSAAQATVTQAQLSLEVARQNVELDVRTRYSSLQTSLITVQTRTTQVQVAELTLAAARTRWQAGTATQDDVSSAELALAQAGRELLSARITAHLGQIALLNAAAVS